MKTRGNISGSSVGDNIRKIPGPRPRNGKERDEDLAMFREMFKQQERKASLLQPDSVEFDANGSYQFYRQSSGRKGYEFSTDSGKNDYDWLKTPPATPLFPSLEMEAGVNAPEFVIHREIPILQPLSRFSGNPIPSGKSTNEGKSKSPKPKPITENLLVVPNVTLRPIRTTIPPPETKANTISSTKSKQTISSITQRKNLPTSNKSERTSTTPTTTKQQQQHQQKKFESPKQLNFLATNLSKRGPISETKAKPRSRGVSPLVRSTIDLTGVSNETPPILKTDRSLSATSARGRNVTGNQRPDNIKKESSSRTTTPLKREIKNNGKNELSTTPMKMETNNNNVKRDSLSSRSVSRGRKIEPKQEMSNKSQTVNIVGGNNGTQVLGSRMVEKFMNARKSSTSTTPARTTTTLTTIEEKDMRMKQINMCGSLNEESCFGRLMSKSHFDVALKRMDLK